ncbi:unnamed protein product, partial [Prorocentrum cordatum]
MAHAMAHATCQCGTLRGREGAFAQPCPVVLRGPAHWFLDAAIVTTCALVSLTRSARGNIAIESGRANQRRYQVESSGETGIGPRRKSKRRRRSRRRRRRRTRQDKTLGETILSSSSTTAWALLTSLRRIWKQGRGSSTNKIPRPAQTTLWALCLHAPRP